MNLGGTIQSIAPGFKSQSLGFHQLFALGQVPQCSHCHVGKRRVSGSPHRARARLLCSNGYKGLSTQYAPLGC